MIFSSGIFRVLRLRCSHTIFPLKSLDKRFIFYPSGPYPSNADKPQTVSLPTSIPHVPPSMVKIVNDQFDDIIAQRDVGKFKSPPKEKKVSPTWLSAVNRRAPSPYDGRTVLVRHDIPITAAWNRLNRILRSNNVRRELRLTARHEQKGEKRRRLRRERWRRRFAHEVRMKVQLVMEMRNRDRLWGAKH